jgi:hypothetical protein
VDNIKLDLREVGWDGRVWIDLAQDRDRLRAFCERGDEPPGSIKCWEVLEQLHNWQLLIYDADAMAAAKKSFGPTQTEHIST